MEDDFVIFFRAQVFLFLKKSVDNKGIISIPNLGIEYPKIFKARKFACRSLKGRGVRSRIRVIFAYYPDKDRLDFIEIYFKGDKENEDKKRIMKHYYKG